MAERLTHTKRRDFLNCPRYFFHRHEQRLALRADKPGRRRGRIFGDALQAARDWNEAQVMGADLEARADMEALGGSWDPIDEALAVVDASYLVLEQEGAVRDQDDSDALDVEQAKLRVMVRMYIERYGLRARREVEFDLPLINPKTGHPSRTFRRAGKIDGLEVIGNKQARVIEDKLVGSVQQAMIDRLPLDMQSNEYVDALLSRGWEASVAYRHTRYPGINPTKEKVLKTKTVPAEALAEFEARLEQDVRDRIDWYFDQQVLFFPRDHLDDYRAGRYGTARMILNARRLARSDGWQHGYPMNPSRCWEYGGCEFIPLCTKQQGAIDRYVVVPDNQELSEKEGE